MHTLHARQQTTRQFQVSVAVLLDNFITASAQMEHHERELETATLLRDNQSRNPLEPLLVKVVNAAWIQTKREKARASTHVMFQYQLGACKSTTRICRFVAISNPRRVPQRLPNATIWFLRLTSIRSWPANSPTPATSQSGSTRSTWLPLPTAPPAQQDFGSALSLFSKSILLAFHSCACLCQGTRFHAIQLSVLFLPTRSQAATRCRSPYSGVHTAVFRLYHIREPHIAHTRTVIA